MPWSNTWNFTDPSGTTKTTKTINSDGSFTETTTISTPSPSSSTEIRNGCVSSSECSSGFACIGGECVSQNTAGATDGGSAGCGDNEGGGGCASEGCTEPSCDDTECECDTGSERVCRTDPQTGEINCKCIPDDEEGKPCNAYCTGYYLTFGAYGANCDENNTCSECYDCSGLAWEDGLPRCTRKDEAQAPCQCSQDLTGDANPQLQSLNCEQCTQSGAYEPDPNCSYEVTCSRSCECGPIEHTVLVPATVPPEGRTDYCYNLLKCPTTPPEDGNCEPEGPVDSTCQEPADYSGSIDPAGVNNTLRIPCGATWRSGEDCKCLTRVNEGETPGYCTQWSGGATSTGSGPPSGVPTGLSPQSAGDTYVDGTNNKTYCVKTRNGTLYWTENGCCPPGTPNKPTDPCNPASESFVCGNQINRQITGTSPCPPNPNLGCPSGKKCYQSSCIDNGSTYTINVKECDAAENPDCPTEEPVECNCHSDCPSCTLCDDGTCGGQDPACDEINKFYTFKVTITRQSESRCCLLSCGCPAGNDIKTFNGSYTNQYWVKKGYYDSSYRAMTQAEIDQEWFGRYGNACLTLKGNKLDGGLLGNYKAISWSGDYDESNTQQTMSIWSVVYYGGGRKRPLTTFITEPDGCSCCNSNCTSFGTCGNLGTEGEVLVTYGSITDFKIVDNVGDP